ncbi:MAG: hypothetical protein BWY19_00902 [bacterium ADurb.Bin212]|nr:MAG: hypothetical protein BWY19_00902 [bacterium ADurb.Bin212]
MKNIRYKAIIYLLVFVQFLYPLSTLAEVRAPDPDDEYVSDIGDTEDYSGSDLDSEGVDALADDDYVYDPDADKVFSDETIPEEEVLATGFEDAEEADYTGLEKYIKPSKYNSENDKILMSSTDKHKIIQLKVAGSVMPNLETDLEELSILSGKSVDELAKMQSENYTDFYSLVEDNQQKLKDNEYVKNRLIANPNKLAEYLGIELGEAIDKLENEKDFVEKEVLDQLNNTIDSRVLKMLAYLITPKNQGGAGHYRIKVERITKNYDTERKSAEKEDIALKEQSKEDDSGVLSSSSKDKTIEEVKADKTEVDQFYDPVDPVAKNIVRSSTAIIDVINAEGETTATALIGDKEIEPDTISSHFYGQAVDISEIDDIKCTLIEKKRIGGSKKTAKPPQAIKLLYQTQAGYNSEKDKIDASYNEMFLSASQSALQSMFSGLNIDFDGISTQEMNNFSDISEAIGKSIFGASIDAPLKDIWNNNLEDLLFKSGGAILADKLGLPKEAFIDTSISSTEELAEAIGRSYIEKNLNLPYGSLSGDSKEEMLKNIGLSRIAQELRLPSNTFSDGVIDSNDLNQKIGSKSIEWEFGFPEGSFYNKNNISDVISNAGKARLDSFFRDTNYIDQKLGLKSGLTNELKNGLPVSEYVKQVAAAKLMRTAYLYPNYNCVDTSRTGFGVSTTNSCSDTDNQATVTIGTESYSNWRDEMMGLPEGTIDSFLNFKNSEDVWDKIKKAGSWTIAKTLEKNDLGRERLSNWLINPNASFTVDYTAEDDTPKQACLPVNSYVAKTKLKGSDLYSIFGKDGESKGIFKRLGKSLLSYSLKPNGKELKMEEETNISLPEFNLPVQDSSFYKEKAQAVNDSLSKLKDRVNNLVATIENKEESVGNKIKDIKQQLSDNLTALEESSNSIKDQENSKKILDGNRQILSTYYQMSGKLTELSGLAKRNSLNKDREISSAIYQLEKVGESSYEISVGNEESDFRYEDINISDINSDLTMSLGDKVIGNDDLALLLSGRVDIATYLKGLGASKLAYSLNIPADALTRVAEALKGEGDKSDSGETLLKSVAVSVLSEKTGVDLSFIGSEETKDKLSVDKLASLFQSRLSTSASKAKNLVAEILGLKGFDLDKLMNGDFSEWSKAREKAQKNDMINNLPKGTTESYVSNKPLGKYDSSIFSKKELSEVSNKLNISEASLKEFIAKKEGDKDAKYNKVYFKSYISPELLSDLNSSRDESNKITATSGYFYHDKNGTHVFDLYEEAEAYRATHKGDEISYLADIVRGLSQKASTALSKIGGADGATGNLQKFLEEKVKTVVNDEAYREIEQSLFDSLSIDRATVKKLFSRSGEDKSLGAVDYLQILGSRYLEKNSLPEINSYLGTDMGFAKIDANDVLRIINGQGKDVLSEVGAYLIDKEMGTSAGSILSISKILDSSSKEKENLVKNTAFELIGNALGIEGLKFDNARDIAKQFGISKLETILGIPSGSINLGEVFDTPEKLLGKIPIFDLVNSLKLPVSNDIKSLASSIISEITGDNSHFSKSFSDQLNLIKIYSQSKGLDGLNPETASKLSELRSKLRAMSDQLLKNTDILTGDVNQAGAALKGILDAFGGTNSTFQLESMLFSLRSQLSSIDGQLSGLGGSLINSLLGTGGVNFDSMLKSISINLLEDTQIAGKFGGAIASVLGIGNDKVVNGLNAVIGNLIGTLSSDFASVATGQLDNLLGNLFSANFDDKAGFNIGTFGNIFNIDLGDFVKKDGVGNALAILVEQGIGKLDSQLGTVGKAQNMVNFAKIAINQIGSGDLFSAVGGVADLAGALNTVVKLPDSVLSAVNIANSIANIAKDSIRSASLLSQEIMSPEGPMGSLIPVMKDLPGLADIDGVLGDIKGIMNNVFEGDFRPLQVIGIVNNIPSILGKECEVGGQSKTCLNVPNDFKFEFKDVFGSVFGSYFGDSGATDMVAEQARQWMIAETNAAGTSEEDVDALTSGQLSLDIPQASVEGTAMAYPGTVEYANIQYPIEAGSNTEIPASLEGDAKDFIINKALMAEANARSSLEEGLGKIFQFKSMDSQLFQEGNLIPANFVRSIMEGSPFDKVNSLKNMVGSFLSMEDGGLAELAGLFGGEKAKAIAQIFTSGGKIDIASVAGALGIDLGELSNSLDKIIMDHAPTIMGINLGEGVASALLSFVHTGNLADSFSGVIKSFKENFSVDGAVSFISNWADEKLGLPAGTAYALYQNFIGSATASFSFAGASFSGPWAIVAQLAFSKIQEFALKIIGTVTGVVEEALGLVPGSLGQLVLSCLIFGPTPLAIAAFIITNLFGVYKTLLRCTADGYYPSLESPPDSSIWDNPGFGTFDGMKSKEREANNIKAAQYKADRLIKDVLEMAELTGDKTLVPVQIMTGRKEDVIANVDMVNYTICPKVGYGSVYPGTGICSGFRSRSGLWQNPQTVAYTHIGF